MLCPLIIVQFPGQIHETFAHSNILTGLIEHERRVVLHIVGVVLAAVILTHLIIIVAGHIVTTHYLGFLETDKAWVKLLHLSLMCVRTAEYFKLTS